MLFVNPGKIVADYISCKRVNYFQPFPLLIILSAIYSLLNHLVNPEVAHTVNIAATQHANGLTIHPSVVNITTTLQTNGVFEKLLSFMINYISENYAFMNIFIIPPFIMAVKIAFRNAGAKAYNFVEYLYGGAYLSSLYIVISLFFLLVECLLKGTSYLAKWDDIAWLVYFLVTFRFFYQLFEGSVGKTIKRTINTYLLYVPFLIIYILIGVGILALIAVVGQGIGLC
jgi:Protein of unknown function (DUF3667).